MDADNLQALDRSVGGRRAQEQQIIRAVRGLFDDQGLRDPAISEIAKAVGINKATIYRHVSSKEELFLLVLCSYQEELMERIGNIGETLPPRVQLDEILDRYTKFCLEYPAYLDCFAGLTSRPYSDLAQRISGSVLREVGRSVAPVNARFAAAIAAGKAQGVFDVEDPQHAAHVAYSAIIGVMQIMRLGVGVQEGDNGLSEVVPLDRDRTVALLIRTVHSLIGDAGPA